MLLSVGRLHIVAIATLACLTFGWFLTGRYLFGLAAVCALDWFLVNFVNRAVDVTEDRINAVGGTAFMAAHRRWLVPASFALLLASFAAPLPGHPAVLPWRVGFHALGFAYNYPLLPGRRRIKQLYFFKNLASAAGFLITLFAYPIAATAPAGLAVPWTTALALATFFLLFELSYEVIYDLRDHEGDRAAGVLTYAVAHGPRGAAAIADGLIVGSVIVLVGSYVAGFVAWRHAVMAAAPLLQLAYYKRAIRRGITGSDCVLLTLLGALLLAVYHVWMALGLPGA